MEPTTTTESVAAPDGPGNTDVTETGAPTQSASEAAKTFTQAELDTIVKARLAEKERTLKTKFEKDLETRTAEARTSAQSELDALVEQRIAARDAEAALSATRATLASEYGLSEAQAARLSGDTPEALQADAEALFGSFKAAQQTVSAAAQARAAVAAEWGLSETQAARLQGDDADALRADAAALFGERTADATAQNGERPKPPILRTGGGGGLAATLDADAMSPSEIRKNKDKLWQQARGR